MIHYHGTPFTPNGDMIKSFTAKHCMVSFERPDQMQIAAEICQSVVLDNGAFSAWRQKKQYDFGGYVEWASAWVKHPCVDWCVIPDVIDGSESDNDSLMAEWPLPKHCSVPVWHMHESLDRLERLLEYPRIALGSSGQFSAVGDAKWWTRMTEAMAVICDSDGMPKSKLHGLRMLDPGVFSKLPLASADSCYVARNSGIDAAWRGPYAMAGRYSRAVLLMERIERHASSHRWNPSVIDSYQNIDLFG
jgi:hypothetical protein